MNDSVPRETIGDLLLVLSAMGGAIAFFILVIITVELITSGWFNRK